MEENRKRNKQIQIRCTEQELEAIDKRVKEFGYSTRNDYIIKTAIDTYIKKLDTEYINKLYYEINRIGNNINQLTRLANSQNEVTQEQIETLSQYIELIFEILQKHLRHLQNWEIDSPSQAIKKLAFDSDETIDDEEIDLSDFDLV